MNLTQTITDTIEPQDPPSAGTLTPVELGRSSATEGVHLTVKPASPSGELVALRNQVQRLDAFRAELLDRQEQRPLSSIERKRLAEVESELDVREQLLVSRLPSSPVETELRDLTNALLAMIPAHGSA